MAKGAKAVVKGAKQTVREATAKAVVDAECAEPQAGGSVDQWQLHRKQNKAAFLQGEVSGEGSSSDNCGSSDFEEASGGRQ